MFPYPVYPMSHQRRGHPFAPVPMGVPPHVHHAHPLISALPSSNVPYGFPSVKVPKPDTLEDREFRKEKSHSEPITPLWDSPESPESPWFTLKSEDNIQPS
ncbi:hypothetical protein SAMN06264849_104134 [Melghirimyces algeriensis]|uniref:Uncharacterized protein n=1 Tax=Melghirimyces algeriensis TaxID=910412 RepID=A0A521CQZ7_9BACL|nr:hypothetical protein SAMN06264849_104134 [Melghirimyces algeriensis]